ncbi:glycosyltransferase family 2 protein [Rhabdothermincola salaria]|uniref:glycosyltransferase family 2 protein n=1 Tax=Rhabdothermincola salaria TaxID=2903142 RepID=UPI001E45139A|nr:glycosyltransferase family 2 protein [Rhabdothermincola salaria]MCD9623383.1 glycosyltransferase family 2 protein [Rhabdothermincola salaria]
MAVDDRGITRDATGDRADGRKLIIQIPCLNEEEQLPATLAELPRHVPGFDVVEWLVIDDGSTDRTVEVARECGVDHIVSLPYNRGLATAFTTGLDAALRAGADVIVNTDADNQYDAACIPDLVAPVVADEADMAVGERPIESIQTFSFVKKRLQRLGSWTVRLFSRTEVRDAASGFRAFSRTAALKVQLNGRYSYTMETLIQAGWENLRVATVPVQVNGETRPSRLVRSMPRYVFHSAQTILRSFVLYKPFRFFFVLGALPFLLSTILVVRWFALTWFGDSSGSRVPSLVAAAVLMLMAFQLWIFGVIADLMSVNRRILSELRFAERLRNLSGPEADDGPATRTATATEMSSRAPRS